jgi:opacity protein-like surface antigen
MKGQRMRLLASASAVAILLSASAALAQSQTPNSTTSNSTTSQPSANSGQNRAAADKIQQDLKNAGFTDVKVVAESFVVQAKSKDGNPVLMTIGPQGMSVFEAMNANGAGSGSNSSKPSGTTGSGGKL